MLYLYRIPAAVVLNILQKKKKKVINLRRKKNLWWLKSLSPLGGEKQIQSGCKLCCRYIENIVEMSVQIKILKTLKSSLITVLNLTY